MKNVLIICSFVFVSISLLFPNSAVGQSLEKCLKSLRGGSSECDKYRSNGGLNKDNKFYGLTVIEIDSYRPLQLILGPSNKKNDVIKGMRKLCGNMVLTEYPNSELWHLKTPNTNENPAKKCTPSCGARNLPSKGTYQVGVTYWSGDACRDW